MYMSIKIRRYHADESDFTFTGRNKTKITVPGNVGFTDLTQSQLVLDMHVDVKEGATTMLYPATFGLRGQVVGAQSLIRNAIVTSHEHGLLNERRHQNVIDSNIDWYLTSRSKEDQRSVYGHCNNKNYGHDTASLLPDNPWLLYNLPPYNAVAVDAFTTTAVTRRAEIPIAWKHIDQFASMPKFPNIGIGDLDYNIELENQIVVMGLAEMAVHAFKLNNITAIGSKIGLAATKLETTLTRANFNRPPMVGDQVTLRYYGATSTAKVDINATIATVTNTNSAGAAIDGYALTFDNGIEVAAATEAITDIVMFRGLYTQNQNTPSDFSAGYKFNDCAPTLDPVGGLNYQVGVAASPLVLPNVYNLGKNQQSSCPFYVGAPLYVTGNIGAVTYTGYRTVASLRPDGDNLQVVLDSALNVGTANTPLLQVRVAWRDYSEAGTLFTVTWTIDEIYAKMHEIQMQQEELNATLNMLRNGKSFAWLDQRLLQQTVTATSTMTQVIELQPNCYSVALLTPQTLELLSGFDGATSYRFALDGKEQSSRDIVCGSDPTTGRSGHNYLLGKYFKNLGQALAKYDANYYDYGSPDDLRTHAIYTQVTPFIPRQQVLQVQLFAGTNTMAAKNLFFVSTHERSLNISNGRVTVT